MGSLNGLWAILAQRLLLLGGVVLLTVLASAAAASKWGALAGAAVALAGLFVLLFLLRPKKPIGRPIDPDS